MENLTLAVATGTAAPGGEAITRKRQRLAHSAKRKKFMYQNLVTQSHSFLLAMSKQVNVFGIQLPPSGPSELRHQWQCNLSFAMVH